MPERVGLFIAGRSVASLLLIGRCCEYHRAAISATCSSAPGFADNYVARLAASSCAMRFSPYWSALRLRARTCRSLEPTIRNVGVLRRASASWRARSRGESRTRRWRTRRCRFLTPLQLRRRPQCLRRITRGCEGEESASAPARKAVFESLSGEQRNTENVAPILTFRLCQQIKKANRRRLQHEGKCATILLRGRNRPEPFPWANRMTAMLRLGTISMPASLRKAKSTSRLTQLATAFGIPAESPVLFLSSDAQKMALNARCSRHA